MATATFSPPRHRKAAQALQLAQPAFHRFELLYHLLELRELLEQPVHVLHARATASRDALAAGAADDLGVAPLARRPGAGDGCEVVQVTRHVLKRLGGC